MKSPQQYTSLSDYPQAIARRAARRWVQATHASFSFFSLLCGFISNNCSLTPISPRFIRNTCSPTKVLGATTYFGRACAFTVLIFLANSSLAETKLLATEVSNAEGWREYRIAVDAQRYAWCGPGTKLVVQTKKDGIKLIDVATWKVQEIHKGSNPVCSEDGKFIYFRVVQPGSVKFVQMTTDTWTRREFDAPVYGSIQIAANGRYIFFTSSGTGPMAGVGLHYLDVPSGKVFTIHTQRLPTFKTDNHVSPGMKYFVAPPDWQRKSITLTGGEKLAAVPLPIAPSGKLFDENYMTDDWVWTPDDRKLVTLTRHRRTSKEFPVHVYETTSGKQLASPESPEGVDYLGASMRLSVGNKVYIYVDQTDDSVNENNDTNNGAQLLLLDLNEEIPEQRIFLKDVISVDFSATGLTIYSRQVGEKNYHDNTEQKTKPIEGFTSILIIDQDGRETHVRNYPFVSRIFLSGIREVLLSGNGQAIVFSRHVMESNDTEYLVVLKRK